MSLSALFVGSYGGFVFRATRFVQRWPVHTQGHPCCTLDFRCYTSGPLPRRIAGPGRDRDRDPPGLPGAATGTGRPGGDGPIPAPAFPGQGGRRRLGTAASRGGGLASTANWQDHHGGRGSRPSSEAPGPPGPSRAVCHTPPAGGGGGSDGRARRAPRSRLQSPLVKAPAAVTAPLKSEGGHGLAVAQRTRAAHHDHSRRLARCGPVRSRQDGAGRESLASEGSPSRRVSESQASPRSFLRAAAQQPGSCR